MQIGIDEGRCIVFPHVGHCDGIKVLWGKTGYVDLSLCPWCGASLLPKPIVKATVYRGKR